MRTRNKIIISVAVMSVVCSCQEESLDVYSGENNVYFTSHKWPSPKGGFSETIEYDGKSFLYENGSTANNVINSTYLAFSNINIEQRADTMFIPVTSMGLLSASARPVGVRDVTSDSDLGEGEKAALAGTHYRILDAFIPADRNVGGVLVELLRDGIEGEDRMVLVLELEQNGDFMTNFRQVPFSSSDPAMTSTLRHRISFDDVDLPVPTHWYTYNTLINYYGPWSRKKYFILTEIIGVPHEAIYSEEWNSTITGGLVAYAGALKRYLAQEKAAGRTVYEEDGVTEMVVGMYA